MWILLKHTVNVILDVRWHRVDSLKHTECVSGCLVQILHYTKRKHICVFALN